VRLHVLALPHAQTVDELTVCAFTTKTTKFCEMMRPLGYEVVLYSGDRNDAQCDEHVQCYTTEEQEEWYGVTDPNTLPSYAVWDAEARPWKVFNARCAAAVLERAGPRDLLLVLGGRAQEPVARACAPLLSCEWAAGYEGWFSDRVCFESYAWMHHCYGVRGIHDGRWFDTVIPNFFRPSEFRLGDGSGGYLLFLGRLIQRKGLLVAKEVADRAGLPLVVAGSGSAGYEDGTLTTGDGCVLEGVDYRGTVASEERAELLCGARALLAPTTYVEPFGAVAVEAQLCGTPAITTDWGAFPETVPQGEGGFRFRTLAEGVEAVERAPELDRSSVRESALKRYAFEAVAPQYDRWFRQLQTLWGKGWYEE
jgi:hypothetical protein